MRDSTGQKRAAQWICEHFLPEMLAQRFSRTRVPLTSGGDHSFAAVSPDQRIVGSISTGSVRNVAGGLAVAKLNKVRADLYFLLLAECDRRLLIITQPLMYEFLRLEQEVYRRIPSEIELIPARLPAEFQSALEQGGPSESIDVPPSFSMK